MAVGPSENDMKRKLFENLKKAGVLDGMKSTLRGRLYEQLRPASAASTGGQSIAKNNLSYKIAASLMVDLMQKCDMPYALSVFLPESGLQQEILSKTDLIEMLGLNKDEYFSDNVKREMTPLLLDIIDVIKMNRSVRPNRQPMSTQTEDSPAHDAMMTLEQKLKRIDSSLADSRESERLIPFKTLEERMLKYKREVE